MYSSYAAKYARRYSKFMCNSHDFSDVTTNVCEKSLTWMLGRECIYSYCILLDSGRRMGTPFDSIP